MTTCQLQKLMMSHCKVVFVYRFILQNERVVMVFNAVFFILSKIFPEKGYFFLTKGKLQLVSLHVFHGCPPCTPPLCLGDSASVQSNM